MKVALGATAPIESVEGDDKEVYQTLFEDNNEGEGMLISLRSLRMC